MRKTPQQWCTKIPSKAKSPISKAPKIPENMKNFLEIFTDGKLIN